MKETGVSPGQVCFLFVCFLHLAAFVSVTVYHEWRLRELENRKTFTTRFFTNKGRDELERNRRNVELENPSLNEIISQEIKRQVSEQLTELYRYLLSDSDDRDKTIRQVTSSGNEMAQLFQQIANSELSIFNKYCGQNSTICLPGPKGEKGDRGLLGRQGVKGDSGLAGEKGDKGDVGLPGRVGVKGDRGDFGLPGPKGQPGAPGAPGTSGPPGLTGDKGDKGDTGQAGSPGLKGATGAAGRKGERGAVGLPGSAGPKGEPGTPGPSGPPGFDGKKGESGQPGQKGEKGDLGQTGQQGIQGPKGLPGPPGAPGAKGARGEKGDTGETRFLVPPQNKSTCCDLLARPIFNQTQAVINSIEGTPVVLTCDVNGHPQPKIYWTKGDGLIISTSPRIMIGSGDVTDSGQYTCHAENALGEANKIVQLNVYKHIKIIERPVNHTLLTGQNAVFECKFNATPTPSVTWYHVNRDGSKSKITDGVITIPQGAQLEIPSVTYKNQGEYICEASNGLETVSQNAYLITEGPPTILPQSQVVGLVGQNLTLHCQVQGHPIPTTTWTAPPNVNNAYEDKNGDLVILNVQVGDAGPYICRATNSFGSTTSIVTVVVHDPGRVDIAGSHNIGVGPSTPNIAIPCKASGEKPLNVQWYHDGKIMTSDSTHVILPDQTLLILAIDRPADFGRYMCVASNKYGSDNKTAIVYEDKGTTTCNVPFAACDNRICGATCPSGCQVLGNSGTLTYAVATPLCLAAIQSGVINSNGGIVTYQTTGTTATIQKP